MSESRDSKAELQAAIDWMFPMTLEWFGLPDEMKRHTEQIEYGLKGSTNDQLRQTWMSTAVPLCEEHGLDGAGPPRRGRPVRARLPVPGEFDEESKRWLLDEGEISWDQVLGALEAARADERGARRAGPARLPADDGDAG